MKTLSGRRILFGLAAPVTAAVIAIAVSSIALLISDNSPWNAYKEMWAQINSTASVVAITNRAVPYYIAGVSVAIGFKMRLFNIGVDGQYLLGSFWGAVFGFSIGAGNLPAPLYVTLIALVSVVTGMLWAAIPALLKIGRNVNEVISTIMLNYVASQAIFYFLRHHFNRGQGMTAQTGRLPAGARIPSLNRLLEVVGIDLPSNVVLQGFLPVAIAVGIGYHVLLNRSRFGYELRVSGENPSAARAAGVNPKRMVLYTFLLSGGIAGLIGMGPLLADPQFGLYGDQFPQSLGFTGLSLALLGRNHPFGVAAAAVVWATIERATQRLSFIGIPQEIGTILQGSFLLTAVIAFEVVRRRADVAEAKAQSRQRTDPPAGVGAAPPAGVVGSPDVTGAPA